MCSLPNSREWIGAEKSLSISLYKREKHVGEERRGIRWNLMRTFNQAYNHKRITAKYGIGDLNVSLDLFIHV
jgi:hypothetical protein